MKRFSSVRLASVWCLGLLLGACADGSVGPGGRSDFGSQDTDDTDTGVDPGDQGDQGPDDGASDNGTPDNGTPDDGTPDNGTPDNGTPDNGTPDGGDDGGGGDDPGVDTGDDLVTPECGIDTTFTAVPTELSDGNGGTRPARIIIEAIDFDNDIVFIRNITNLTGTNETINFDGDWGIAITASQTSLSVARNLPPGGRMAIHMKRQGFNTATNTYLNLGGDAWDMEACAGEVAIQDRTGDDAWTNRPEIIEAFVRWGSGRTTVGSDTATFTDEAFDAEAWLVGNGSPATEAAAQTCWADADEDICNPSAATCPGLENHQAIIAIGDVRDPEGWYSAPASEFVNCP